MRNRYFSSEPAQNSAALALYESVKDLPLICPHGHVDPRMFADPHYQFGSPVDLLIIPRPLHLPHVVLARHIAGRAWDSAPGSGADIG